MLHSKYKQRLNPHTLREDDTMPTHSGGYTASHSLVEYILGITYEIWEEGGVDLIEQYYADDTIVYAMDGITIGSAAMIEGTNSMLAAFPDRLLLGDDVIGKGDSHRGYSSHRVLSPMTNSGDSQFGPATGRQVRIMNVADCVVEDGVIVKEWLARDNLALVRQLGFPVGDAARLIASNRTKKLTAWFDEETARLESAGATTTGNAVSGIDPQQLLHALWVSGDESIINSAYPHYAVLHRSPVEIISGRESVVSHYERLRAAFEITGASIDHVCQQSGGDNVSHVAVRWAVCGKHRGDWFGVKPEGRPINIMGVTQRRIVDGRVAVEWTVFDSLALLAQLIRS